MHIFQKEDLKQLLADLEKVNADAKKAISRVGLDIVPGARWQLDQADGHTGLADLAVDIENDPDETLPTGYTHWYSHLSNDKDVVFVSIVGHEQHVTLSVDAREYELATKERHHALDMD